MARHRFSVCITMNLLMVAAVASSADICLAQQATTDKGIGRKLIELGERVPIPTMGGKQVWADELFFHDWRIQRNVVLKEHCRLLDGNNLRRAWGTFEHCFEKLSEIRRDQKLPPMEGAALVLLHGLGRSRSSMSALAKYAKKDGQYTTFNVGYPSTRREIADHAKALAKIIQNLHGIERIDLVGHSMGNIVIRRYLGDQTDDSTSRKPDPRIKRIVMLGPPNHGSVIATALRDNGLFTAVMGKPGQELGREWAWLEADLATPRCEFGIIAGGLANDSGFNPALPGDDDGVVAVASARLDGATDFVLLPVLHSVMPLDRKVQAHTLRFLKTGRFEE
jgi:pimeloyl-ACP methyl ester carboxylesterase